MKKTGLFLQILVTFFLLSFPAHSRIPEKGYLAWKEKGAETGLSHPGFLAELCRLINSTYAAWIAIPVHQEKTEPEFRIDIKLTPYRRWLKAEIDLRFSGEKNGGKSRLTLPGYESPGLLPGLAGEIFYLWAKARGIHFPLQPPPYVTAVLETSILEEVISFPPPAAPLPSGENESPDPLKLRHLTSGGKPSGLLLTLDSSYLRLDEDFRILPSSLEDVMAQHLSPPQLPLRQTMDPGSGILLCCDYTGVVHTIPEDKKATPFPPFTHWKRLPGGKEVLLSQGQLWAITRTSAGDHQKTAIPSPGGYLSALGTDHRIWVFDGLGKYLNLHSAEGSLLSRIRPLIPEGSLAFPTVIEIFPDASFLLGGSGEIIKFSPAGLPVWKLDTMRLGVAENLPSHYSLIPQADKKGFILGDTLNNRLLTFREPEETPPLSDYYPLEKENLNKLINRFLTESRYLLALQYTKILATQNPNLEDQQKITETRRTYASMQAAYLAVQAGRYKEGGNSERAELFYRYALKEYEALRIQFPVDPELPHLLELLTKIRRSVRKESEK